MCLYFLTSIYVFHYEICMYVYILLWIFMFFSIEKVFMVVFLYERLPNLKIIKSQKHFIVWNMTVVLYVKIHLRFSLPCQACYILSKHHLTFCSHRVPSVFLSSQTSLVHNNNILYHVKVKVLLFWNTIFLYHLPFVHLHQIDPLFPLELNHTLHVRLKW